MYTCSLINRYWKFVIEMINDRQIKKIKRKKKTKQKKHTPKPNEQTKPNPQNKPIYIDLILQSLKSRFMRMHVLWIDAKKKRPHEYHIVNWSNFFLCRKYSNAIEIIFSIALIDLI